LPDNISTQSVRGKLLEGQKLMNEAEWVKTIQENRFAAVNANVLWPLYTGGKINAAIKASEIEKDEAELNSQLKRNELLSELVARYYGLCLAQQAVNVREQVLDAMNKHLCDSQKLSEQGQIARVQFLHAQVAVSNADSELKKANREMEIVERALQNTIVSDESVSIKTISPLFFLKEIENEAMFIELAKNNNTHLKLVQSKKELAKVGVQLKKSKYLPDVVFSGTYDLVNKDLSPYLPKWTLGLGMKWTLFEGNARPRKLESARYKQVQVEEAGLKIEEDILTGIRKYHQELAMQSEQIESLEKTLEFANAYRESHKKAFSEGLASSSDLVDANLLVAKTKIERLQAMYTYDKSLANLLQLCGQPQLFNRYMSSDKTINESL
jgi:outer membrane protein TolC